MTGQSFINVWRNWRYMLSVGLPSLVVGMVVSGFVALWIDAGHPEDILIEHTSVVSTQGKHWIVVELLRRTRHRYCTSSPSRWLSAAVDVAPTPEMRQIDPRLPAIVHTTISYPISNQPVPRGGLGTELREFALPLPTGLPNGTYTYNAVLTFNCPLLPMRQTVVQATGATFSIADDAQP